MTDNDTNPLIFHNEQQDALSQIAKRNNERRRIWAEGFRELDLADHIVRDATQGKTGLFNARNDLAPTNTIADREATCWTLVNPQPTADRPDAILQLEIYPYRNGGSILVKKNDSLGKPLNFSTPYYPPDDREKIAILFNERVNRILMEVPSLPLVFPFKPSR